MALVGERVLHTENVMRVRSVVLIIELREGQFCPNRRRVQSDQIKDRHLHLRLVQVRRLVLDNFDGANVVCPQILTFYDLPESALAQYIQNQIPARYELNCRDCAATSSPVSAMLPAEDIVDKEDIIPIFVIDSVVMYRLARFRQYSARVVRRLVVELRIAQRVRLRQSRSQAFQRLQGVSAPPSTTQQNKNSH